RALDRGTTPACRRGPTAAKGMAATRTQGRATTPAHRRDRTAGRVAATRTPGRAITPARRRGPTADKAAAKGKVATATHSVLLARPLSSGRCRGRRKLYGETGLFARQLCYV